MKVDFQSGQVLCMGYMDLRVQRFFYNFVRDGVWQGPFRGGNIGCGIGHARKAIVDVFVQKIAAEL